MTIAHADNPPFPKIQSLKIRPRYRVEVVWDDNSSSIIEMQDLIANGNAFAPLKDPDLFATARIGERRRTIEWPDPTNPSQILVDYCADALDLRAKRQTFASSFQRILREMRILRNKVMHSSQQDA